MFGLRGEMKKRTDQLLDCINSVKPVLTDLTDQLAELTEAIKKNDLQL